ncbi:hypothetical protein K449DRAFT_459973 [Hypoxylon sp. EC38]|nr:hypothetical protein K449DRAFT_459973 [Hypoxylon sp. EC38]
MSSRKTSVKETGTTERDDSPPRDVTSPRPHPKVVKETEAAPQREETEKERPFEADEDEDDEEAPKPEKGRAILKSKVKGVLDKLRQKKAKARHTRKEDSEQSSQEEGLDPIPEVPEEEPELIPEEQPLPPVPELVASLATIPTELLLQILEELDPSGRVNLAIALPEIFLSPGRLDVFTIDAENQWERYRRQPPTSTFEASWDYYIPEQNPWRKPLLLVAIEDGHSSDTINRIIDAYNKVSPDAVNDIFLFREFPTPLETVIFPTPLGTVIDPPRPEMLRLLLDRGLDTSLRGHMNRRYLRHFGPPPCRLVNVPHRTCMFPSWIADNDRLDCDDLLNCAISHHDSTRDFTADVSSRETLARLEECISILSQRTQIVLTTDDGLGDTFKHLIEAGVDGVVRRLIEETASGNGSQRDSLQENLPVIIETLVGSYNDWNGADPVLVGTQRQTAQLLRMARRDDLIHYIFTELRATIRPESLADVMLRYRHSRGPITALQAIFPSAKANRETWDLLGRLANAKMFSGELLLEIEKLWASRLLVRLSDYPPMKARFLFSALRHISLPYDPNDPDHLRARPSQVERREMYRWLLREYHMPLSLQAIYIAINHRDNILLDDLIATEPGSHIVFHSNALEPAKFPPPGFSPSPEELTQEPSGSYTETANLYDTLAFMGLRPLELALIVRNGYAASRLLELLVNPERVSQEVKDGLFEQFEANALPLDVWTEIGRTILGDRFYLFDPDVPTGSEMQELFRTPSPTAAETRKRTAEDFETDVPVKRRRSV